MALSQIPVCHGIHQTSSLICHAGSFSLCQLWCGCLCKETSLSLCIYRKWEIHTRTKTVHIFFFLSQHQLSLIAWNKLIFSSLHLGSSSVATAGWLWIIYHYCFPLMEDLLDFRYIHVPWWIWSSSCLQLEKQGLICFVWALVWKDVTVNCCSEAMLKKW